MKLAEYIYAEGYDFGEFLDRHAKSICATI